MGPAPIYFPNLKTNRMNNLRQRLSLILLRLFPAETSHNLTIKMLKLGISLSKTSIHTELPETASKIFNLSFSNPIGLAAGFDKDGEVFDQLASFGPGFIEAGTLTLRSQPGNPRPRVFRLKKHNAVINRYGFNNKGIIKGLDHLAKRRNNSVMLGINIGINKDTETPIEDYLECLTKAKKIADYVTVNISSPNTPGLRSFQQAEKLEELLNPLVRFALNDKDEAQPLPLLLKIAPDLADKDINDIVEVAVSSGISGIIVSNTTVSRPPDLADINKNEVGGLSGAPLFELSTKKLAQTFLAAKKRIPIIGVGGVENSETAYAKIKAGASLLQLYTALTYKGPQLFSEINKGLSKSLKNDNLKHISEAVGIDAESWASKDV